MRIQATFAACSLAAMGFLGGCGGDDEPSNPDAPVIDASMIDGAITPTRTATLSVAEVDVTTPGAAAVGGISGGSVLIDFQDLTIGGGEVVFGTGAPGTCTVVHYTAGTTALEPHPSVDEGAVTITGTVGAPMGPCVFISALGEYKCPAGMGSAVASGAQALGSPTFATVYTFTGQTFNSNLRGTYLNVSGFTTAGFNGTFPVQTASGATITVLNTNFASPDTETGQTANYTLFQGAAPIPLGSGPDVDFLDDGANPVMVTLAANAHYPEGISQSIRATGQGLAAGTNCADCRAPHDFPFNIGANDTVSFSCAEAEGGDCGALNAGQLAYGVVVSGTASDASISGLSSYEMPDPVGATKWATFTCSTIMGDKVTIPNAALAQILAVNPSRIETRFFRFGFALPTDTQTRNDARILVGHGLVGHTDPPQL